MNIDAQQAAERNQTLQSKSNFIRAVSAAITQTFATDKLLATINELSASIAALKEKNEYGNNRYGGPSRGRGRGHG